LTSAFLLPHLFTGFAGGAAALDVEGLAVIDEHVTHPETAATTFECVVRVDAGGAAWFKNTSFDFGH
jgi:hypothetical protein